MLVGTPGETFQAAILLPGSWTFADFTGGIVFQITDLDGTLIAVGSEAAEIAAVTGTSKVTVTFSAAQTASWPDDDLLWSMTGTITGPPVQVHSLGQGEISQYGWLKPGDLEKVASASTVDQLFNDTNTYTRDVDLLATILRQAETQAEAELLRSYSSDQVAMLVQQDEAIKMHTAWIAIEFACERKREFLADDGKGRYWAQFDRAMKHLSALGKSKIQSRGASRAGAGANTGGSRLPRQAGSKWTFADESDGSKHGGF